MSEGQRTMCRGSEATLHIDGIADRFGGIKTLEYHVLVQVRQETQDVPPGIRACRSARAGSGPWPNDRRAMPAPIAAGCSHTRIAGPLRGRPERPGTPAPSEAR